MTRRRKLIAIGAALALAVTAIVIVTLSRGDDRNVADRSRGADPALATKGSKARRLRSAPCITDDLLAELRTAQSPAYQRYIAELFLRRSADLSRDDLEKLFAAARDPQTLELVGKALAQRYDQVEPPDPTILALLASRLRSETDPKLKRAIVRALGATGEPASIALARNKLEGYPAMAKDPSPDVRQAIADNLVEEGARSNYRDGEVTTVAIEVAKAAPDLAGALLGRFSLEEATAEQAGRIAPLLRADNRDTRAAAASLLGTASANDAPDAVEQLVAAFQRDTDPIVRKAILAAIVRLGFGRSVVTLRSLRGADPSVDAEIELWLSALASGAHEWTLLLREKERLERQS